MFKHYDTSNRNFLQIEDLNKAFVKGGKISPIIQQQKRSYAYWFITPLTI
jgi:hypothetical protein